MTVTHFSHKYPIVVGGLNLEHYTTQKGTALEMSLGLLLWGHFNEFKTAWKLLQLYKGEEKETLYSMWDKGQRVLCKIHSL